MIRKHLLIGPRTCRLHSLVWVGAFLLLVGTIQQAHAFRLGSQLVRCSETPWTGVCGGDNLAQGQINIKDGGVVRVGVREALADPFNLYEVYWLPIGAAVTDAVKVGNFATDCDGNAATSLKDITTPHDILHGALINMYTQVHDVSAGNFLVYSRGPSAFDYDGDCSIDQLNTVPLGTDPMQPLANPVVDLATSGVQFISGYQN